MGFSEKSKDKFFRNIQLITESGCHIYCAGTPTSHGGHIVVKFDKRRLMAHRMAWEIAFGKIPFGMRICHKCDVVSCVNPNHLFMATQTENIADRHRKGRTKQGEGVGTSKLTIEQVKKIRILLEQNISLGKISKEFSIARSQIAKIRDREAWKSI